MLKRILTQKRYLKNLYKSQKGITGLETAIILIAFVVVAAVFAYTVLSAGLFSTQKSQEAVYSGLQQTQNTLEVKGSVLTTGTLVNIDDCSALGTWAGSSSLATGTDVPSIMVTKTGAGTKSYNSTTQTLQAGDVVTFWARLASAADQNNYQVAVGTDNTLAVANTPISVADIYWHKYTVTLTGNDQFYGIIEASAAAANCYVTGIAVNRIGLYSSTNPVILFANQALITLSLASGGEAIDFTETNDPSPSTGLLGDKTTRTNKLVVNYTDSTQQVSDLAWTKSFIGSHSGSGNMLDKNDKVQVIVDLSAVNKGAAAANKIGPNHTFTMEIKTATGSVLTIQRSMSSRLHTIDDLN